MLSPVHSRCNALSDAPSRPDDDRNDTLADLAARCVRSVGEDGYGYATIDYRVTVSNEVGEIPVPCRIRPERDGWLQLNNVDLRSKHLSISDYGTNGETRVIVNNSNLLAAGRHGFLLQLSDAQDSVAARNSTIDYPLSVWVQISGQAEDAPGGGRIEVSNSVVRAADPQSDDGIQLVAGELGGRARFLNLKLDAGDLKSDCQNALLFAGDCQATRVEGFPNRCGPQEMLQRLEKDTDQ